MIRGPAVAGLLWLPPVVTALLGAAGYLPTRRFAGAAGVEAMIAALALVLGVVYATLLSARRRIVAAPDVVRRFKAAFRAGMERFILTLALAAAIAWRSKLDASTFLVWVAVGYVVMIKVETLILIRWGKRFENQA